MINKEIGFILNFNFDILVELQQDVVLEVMVIGFEFHFTKFVDKYRRRFTEKNMMIAKENKKKREENEL